jgi:hypothetical protein
MARGGDRAQKSSRGSAAAWFSEAKIKRAALRGRFFIRGEFPRWSASKKREKN